MLLFSRFILFYCKVWFAEYVVTKEKSALFFDFFSLMPLILPYKEGEQKKICVALKDCADEH